MLGKKTKKNKGSSASNKAQEHNYRADLIKNDDPKENRSNEKKNKIAISKPELKNDFSKPSNDKLITTKLNDPKAASSDIKSSKRVFEASDDESLNKINEKTAEKAQHTDDKLLNKNKKSKKEIEISSSSSSSSESDSEANKKLSTKNKKNLKEFKGKKNNQEIQSKSNINNSDDEIIFEKTEDLENDFHNDVNEESITDDNACMQMNLSTEIKTTKKPKAQNKNFTLSIVIPSSVVDNAQSKELRSYLVGQIARTAAIFKVDEIIIFHDRNKSTDKDYINFFVTNLQYLETPQYLRKTLFPRCDDLANSGLMNPLDSNHHLRIDEWCNYREGVILNRPVKENNGSWCNIGLYKDCKINQKLEEKTRVTVKLNEKNFDTNLKFYSGSLVSVTEPKEKLHLYWGYLVRIANNFDELFNQSSFGGNKYDLIIGTSDKGQNYSEANYDQFRDFKHCLIVFGGLQGIEGMLEYDEKYKVKDKDIEKMFDLYLNTCPDQGCRTIRTEEAIMISLSILKPILSGVKI